MKKFIALILSLVMVFSMTACGSSETKSEATETGAYKVAIVQQLDHSSLDEIRTAITAQLNTLAAEKGITITIEEYNGQTDGSMLNQIATQVVADEADMIIPIATLAAVAAVNATEGTDIPVVYAAISDPESAGLTGIPTVTGVSDALNTKFILDMMFAAQPDIQCVGLLYSNSEVNSQTPIAEAKAYLEEKGIEYLEKTGTTSGEVLEAAVAEVLNADGIPHYTGADSFVTSGAFTTCGVNYTELGTKTADMAFDILLGGEIGDSHVMDGGIITVNTDTAAACGIDYSVFNTMANTVNAVSTIAD